MKYVFIGILLCIISVATKADLLGQYSSSGARGATYSLTDFDMFGPGDFVISFNCIEGGNIVGQPSNTIWFDLTGADVGKTAYATNRTHASFSYLASLLTDATDQEYNAIIWWPESKVYGRRGARVPFWESDINKNVLRDPDFTGLTVGTIALTLDQFDYYPPELDNSHTIDYAVTVSFYSDVIPEPATLSLLALGTMLAWRKRKI